MLKNLKKKLAVKFQDWKFAIYVMHLANGIAGSLVGIFIPIYFLTLGYSLSQVFIFFIVNNFAILLFSLTASRFAKQFGLVKTLLLRLIFLFLNLFLLYNLKTLPNSFYLISVLSAAEIAFYWFTVHVVFAKSSEIESIGEHVGKLAVIPKMASLVSPLLGAGITALFGFRALFLFAGGAFLVSVVPFLLIEKIPLEVKLNFHGVVDYIKRYKKYFVAEFLMSIPGEIEGFVLPIFLFLTFRDVLSVGFLATCLALGGVVFTLLVGKYSDRVSRKTFMRIGSVVLIAAWLGMYLANNQLSFYGLSGIIGFFGALVFVPFSSIFYINAKNNHIEDFVIFRELPISLGRILLYVTALFLLTNIKLTFLFSSLPFLFFLFY